MTDDDILRIAEELCDDVTREEWRIAFARRILAEAQRSAEPPFGYWDFFNEVLYRGDDAAAAAAASALEGGNKVIPLYAAPQRTAQEQMPETARTGAAIKPESSVSVAAPRTNLDLHFEQVTAAVTTICGAVSPIGLLCKFKPYHSSPHSWDTCYAPAAAHEGSGGGSYSKPAAATPRTDHYRAKFRQRKETSDLIEWLLDEFGQEERENAELRAALEASEKTFWQERELHKRALDQLAAERLAHEEAAIVRNELRTDLTNLQDALEAERKAREEAQKGRGSAIWLKQEAIRRAEAAEARVRELEAAVPCDHVSRAGTGEQT